VFAKQFRVRVGAHRPRRPLAFVQPCPMGVTPLGLGYFCVCFLVFLTRASLFVIGLVVLGWLLYVFYIIFSSCLVVSTSAINCLERPVPK